MPGSCRFLIICLGLFAFVSCSKYSSGGDGGTEPPNPQIIPEGATLGAATTTTVDAAGGSFSSADGAIKIDVPAGAVAGPTQFSVQPVENTCLNGIGVAYKLLPENQTFSKPITVTMNYSDSLADGTDPQAIAISYRDYQGICRVPQNQVSDTSAKTVTAIVSHFCIFHLYAAYSLQAEHRWLKKGSKTNVTLMQTDYTSQSEGDPYLYGSKYDLNPGWTLEGDGSLTASSKFQSCTYSAPNFGPTSNPHVVCKLSNLKTPSGKKATLVIRYGLRVGDYLDLEFDGEYYNFTSQQYTLYMNGVDIMATNSQTGDKIGIFITGNQPGSYPFAVQSNVGPGTTVQLSLGSGEQAFSSYVNCSTNQYAAAKGSFTLLHVSKDTLQGNFEGMLAEYGQGSNRCQISFKPIRGKFGILVN